MIYEFTKSRSTAVAEIEPQLIDIIENIPTPSIAVAEIEPLMINTIADNKLEYQLIEKDSFNDELVSEAQLDNDNDDLLDILNDQKKSEQ